MKYLGERSLSSFLSVFFKVAWIVVLVIAVICGLAGIVITFIPVDDPSFLAFAKAVEMDLQHPDWITFKSIPLIVRLLFVPYYIALVVLLLKLMEKAKQLFTNFKNDVVFHTDNVMILTQFSKVLIIFSIMTFDFSSLLVSLLLLLLCEIFKNGTALQEEHDLTV